MKLPSRILAPHPVQRPLSYTPTHPNFRGDVLCPVRPPSQNESTVANPYVWLKPERPVPPERTTEVAERTDFAGQIITPEGVEAVRVSAKACLTK